MSLKQQAISGVFWLTIQQFSTQAISFVVSIILARLLLPQDFGLIGLIYIFITLGNLLLDAGLTQSLIITKDPDQEDYSTIFFFNLLASILIYIVVYILAPFIANFYYQPQLLDLIRVYCITFVITAFTSVQNTRLIKSLDFKKLMIINIPSTIISGIVGITMACYGFGVWSLVWSSIAKVFFASAQLWVYGKWMPTLTFNKDKLNHHIKFGYKLTINELINSLFINVYPFLIGRFYSITQVGYYTQSETIRQVPVSTLSGVINKVTFPLLVKVSDDNEKFIKAIKQLCILNVFVILPVMIFIIIDADMIITILLGNKWLPAVPFLTLLASIGCISALYNLYGTIFNVLGKSFLILRVNLIEKIITVFVVLIAVKTSVIAIVVSNVLTTFFGFLIRSYYLSKNLDFKMMEQFNIQKRNAIVLILFMISLLLMKKFIHTSSTIIDLIVHIICGGIVFLTFTFLINKNVMNQIKLVIKWQVDLLKTA